VEEGEGGGNGASEEAERGARRFGERGAGAGATERHLAADADVRSPRGGRSLSAVGRRCAARARTSERA
jgi:hypothetical protein